MSTIPKDHEVFDSRTKIMWANVERIFEEAGAIRVAVGDLGYEAPTVPPAFSSRF